MQTNTHLIPAEEHPFCALSRRFASPECRQQRNAPAENKALRLRDVNERVVCSHPDRGAKIFSARKLINTTPHSRQAQQSAKTRRDAKRIRELEFVCDAMLAASFSSQPDIFREQDLAHHRVAFRIERLGSVRRY
jgi:hypothetical protein